jgi:hypothetical protein
MHINAATRLVALDNNVPGTPGTTIAPAQSYRPDNEADLHNRQGDMHNDSQSELKHESVKPKTNTAVTLNTKSGHSRELMRVPSLESRSRMQMLI